MPATILAIIPKTAENIKLRTGAGRAAKKHGEAMLKEIADRIERVRPRNRVDWLMRGQEDIATHSFNEGVAYALRVLHEQQTDCERPRVGPPTAPRAFPLAQIIGGRRYRLKNGRMIEVVRVNRKLQEAHIIYTATGRNGYPPLDWLSERIDRLSLLPNR